MLSFSSIKKHPGMVRPVDWDTEDRRVALDAVLGSAEKARAALALAGDEQRVAAFGLSHAADYPAGEVVRVDALVDSWKYQASKLELTLTVQIDETGFENCKEGSKPREIDGNGKIHYDKSCDTVDEKTIATITVPIADFPASIVLKKGDQLRVYAKAVSWKSSPEKRSGRVSLVQKSLVLSDGYLAWAQRGKTAVGSFDGSVSVEKMMAPACATLGRRLTVAGVPRGTCAGRARPRAPGPPPLTVIEGC